MEQAIISQATYDKLKTREMLWLEFKKKKCAEVITNPGCDGIEITKIITANEAHKKMIDYYERIIKMQAELRQAKDKEILQLKIDIKTMAGRIAEQQRSCVQPKKPFWKIWK